jgi:O-antigen/teichoic acid export membrane protein
MSASTKEAVPLHWLVPNTIWNILGAVLPTFVALISVPHLLASLGVERFGLLTLMWNLIGYFGVLDLGMSRGLTKIVAESRTNSEENKGAVQHGLIAIFALGAVGGILSAILSPSVGRIIAAGRPDLQTEFTTAFYVMSLSIPAVILSAGLRGIVEGWGLFKWSNVIRLCAGIYTFSSPFLLPLAYRNLQLITTVLVIGRIATTAAYAYVCLKVMPGLRAGFEWDFSVLKPLMRFGGWLTLSNLMGIALSTAERMIIATAVSVAALSYFNTPAEIITRLAILPVAVSTVLFPRLSEASSSGDQQAAAIFWQGTRYILMVFFPVTLFSVAASHLGLSLWLGKDFADNAALVLAWMSISVFFSGFVQLAVTTLQACGRPEITGLYQAVELPIYVIGMIFFARRFGVTGAAFAGTIRYGIDFCFLMFSSNRLVRGKGKEVLAISGALAMGTIALIIPVFVHSLAMRIAYAVAITLAFSVLSWRILLNSDEQSFVLRRFYAFTKP